jgi:TRAP-type C4-dicarboxylate transport system permease large subunit
MGIAGIVGVGLVFGTAMAIARRHRLNTSTNFSLVAIPMFILMGESSCRAASRRGSTRAGTLFAARPAGWPNIAGCRLLGRLRSSVATAMTVGSIALKSSRRGYKDG